MPKNKHLKAILVGGSIFGAIGAFLGFMSGLTVEGALGGFILGWVVGEIFGLGASETDG